LALFPFTLQSSVLFAWLILVLFHPELHFSHINSAKREQT
jgi:hypothetical protein